MKANGTSKKRVWLLLVAVLALLLIGFAAHRYLNPRVVLYSEMSTYTMADDGEIYLSRTPWFYVEPFLPGCRVSRVLFPAALQATLDTFAMDVSEDKARYWQRYQGHFNLDYTLASEEGQLVVTSMGYGKLADGTIETIDTEYRYPLFPYEDQTAGCWDAPRYPWVDAEDKRVYHDPNYVLGSAGAAETK